MKTNIPKEFHWSFTLTEQELRRILQVCRTRMAKINPPIVPQEKFVALLKGGPVSEESNIDEILAIENSGSKTIQSLELRFSDKDQDPQWEIKLIFQDSFLKPPKRPSILLTVLGQDRDWALIAESEIEERLRQVKRPSIAHIFTHQYIVMSFIAIALITGMALAAHYSNQYFLDLRKTALAELETRYAAGEFQHPIEVTIFYEKFMIQHNPSSITQILTMSILFLCVISAVVICLAGLRVLPWMFPPYNFYWGDNIALLDRRKTVTNYIITVVIIAFVLGTGSSILASYLYS